MNVQAMTSSFDALICDCDGVLIDSEAVASKVLVELLERRWPALDIEPLIQPLLGLRIERVLDAMAAHAGDTLSDDDVEQIRRKVEDAAVLAPAVPGIADALDRIGLPKACASNSHTEYVETALIRTGLARFFDNRLWCADRVAHPKPAPDVYLRAAADLGVPPARCLVVEDSVTGVTAAVRASMPVLGYIGGAHASAAQIRVLREAGALHVFEDMRQLPSMIAQLSAARVLRAAQD
ncbi:HAD family hydrolase [Pararobbsia silviterrae]|uniref:HAD family phosphatase n=1 Tax=Pararobbsia silviterrae TaxID=1792498 RepID=A0A494XMA9_9BURK|nr:HAD family phosphatase [Pararobbsia silviterrae]RKP48673.1 HAD family phosphatase [Pararobbsia silviterrae]